MQRNASATPTNKNSTYSSYGNCRPSPIITYGREPASPLIEGSKQQQCRTPNNVSRTVSPNDEIINNFSNSPKKQSLFQESVCYLKTNSNRFKEHWAVLSGNEIYCYRNKGDS